MKLDQYQKDASLSHGYFSCKAEELAIFTLGVAGEAGEVAELVKKHLGHNHPLDHDAMVKELGDVLWYLTALCTSLDISLSHVAAMNLAKVRERYPNGFDPERSKEIHGISNSDNQETVTDFIDKQVNDFQSYHNPYEQP